MLTPSSEKSLLKNGYCCVIGVDEAGRGPWAGPVVVASYVFRKGMAIYDGINDSKKMTVEQREKAFEFLTNDRSNYGVGIASNTKIDEIGILGATKEALLDAISEFRGVYFMIIDGKFDLEIEGEHKFENKADGTYYAVACASIIAKVTRDRLMGEYAKEYPMYGFERHKGYGTKLHREMLQKYGPCEIHRFSYKPVAKYAQ